MAKNYSNTSNGMGNAEDCHNNNRNGYSKNASKNTSDKNASGKNAASKNKTSNNSNYSDTMDRY